MIHNGTLQKCIIQQKRKKKKARSAFNIAPNSRLCLISLNTDTHISISEETSSVHCEDPINEDKLHTWDSRHNTAFTGHSNKISNLRYRAVRFYRKKHFCWGAADWDAGRVAKIIVCLNGLLLSGTAGNCNHREISVQNELAGLSK